MAIPTIPSQCKLCVNFNLEDCICKHYEELPGEGDRRDIKDCPSFFARAKEDDLKLLAEYIDEDKDKLVEQRIDEAVNTILQGYDTKFKVMVVGIARRKIKAMVKMVDIIDILLNKLADIDDKTVQGMTPGQTIRLLSELNASVNNDLSFVMKLVQPDSDLKDLQVYIENKTLNINGTTPATEMKTEEILELTGTSRDKIRDAFEALLNNIEVPGVEDVYEPKEGEKEDIESL
jgi:hypothetical protein